MVRGLVVGGAFVACSKEIKGKGGREVALSRVPKKGRKNLLGLHGHGQKGAEVGKVFYDLLDFLPDHVIGQMLNQTASSREEGLDNLKHRADLPAPVIQAGFPQADARLSNRLLNVPLGAVEGAENGVRVELLDRIMVCQALLHLGDHVTKPDKGLADLGGDAVGRDEGMFHRNNVGFGKVSGQEGDGKLSQGALAFNQGGLSDQIRWAGEMVVVKV